MISSDADAWKWLYDLKDSRMVNRIYTSDEGLRRVYLQVEIPKQKIQIEAVGSSLVNLVNEIINHLDSEGLIDGIEGNEASTSSFQMKKVYKLTLEEDFSEH